MTDPGADATPGRTIDRGPAGGPRNAQHGAHAVLPVRQPHDPDGLSRRASRPGLLPLHPGSVGCRGAAHARNDWSSRWPEGQRVKRRRPGPAPGRRGRSARQRSSSETRSAGNLSFIEPPYGRFGEPASIARRKHVERASRCPSARRSARPLNRHCGGGCRLDRRSRFGGATHDRHGTEHDDGSVRPAGRRRRPHHLAADRRRRRLQPNGYELVGIPDGLGMIRAGTPTWCSTRTTSSRDAQGHRPPPRPDRRVRVALGHRSRRRCASRRARTGSIPGVQYWDYPSGIVRHRRRPVRRLARSRIATFGRFCSGTLSDPGLFYNASTRPRLEGPDLLRQRGGRRQRPVVRRDQGRRRDRAAAARPLPWENTPRPRTSRDTTLVMGDEDGPPATAASCGCTSAPSSTAARVDKAGLTNGTDLVVDEDNATVRTDALPLHVRQGREGPRRSLAHAWDPTGELRTPSPAVRRPEPQPDRGRPLGSEQPERLLLHHDRGWVRHGQPRRGPTFDAGGLWRLRWDDIEDPDAGATLQLLLDGTEDPGAGE